MKSALYIGFTATSVALILLRGGCGGGGGAVGPPPPPSGTAQIQGEVRAADNISMTISYAEVTAQPAAVTTITGSLGSFALTNLPAGDITLQVNPLQHPSYQAMTLVVPTEAGKITRVTVALLPTGTDPPTQITVAPSNPSVEVGGVIGFGSTVTAASGELAVMPSWLLTGDIGYIGATGQFHAQKIGTGVVAAIAGGVSAATNVTVIPPQPPDISTVIVSPFSLPASGGVVSIVAAISDGQGIDVDGDGNPLVEARITLPDSSELDPPLPMALDAGTLQDGTYRTTYQAPPNDNIPNMWGIQAPQTYTVHVRAWDTVGTSATSDPYDFTVQGVEAPPVPPPP